MVPLEQAARCAVEVRLPMGTAGGVPNRQPVSIWLNVVVATYLATVILLSYREGLTYAARAAGVTLVVSSAVYAYASRRAVMVPTAFRLWLLWLVVAVTTVVYADRADLAIWKILTVCQVIAMAVVLSNVLTWNGSSGYYRSAIVLLGLVSCGAVWFDPEQFADADGRVFGPLGNANAFGAMLVTAFIFVTVEAFAARTMVRSLIFGAAAIVFFMSILQTGSRQALLGSMIAVVSVVVGMTWKVKRGLLRRFVILAYIGVLGAGAAYVAMTSEYWFRMEAFVAAAQGNLGDADSSLVERIVLYRRGIELAAEHPIAGIGLDNFRAQQRFPGSGPIGTYSHSNYLEIMVSTGFVGFALYYTPFVLWLSALIRCRHLVFIRNQFPCYMRVATVLVTFLAMDFATVSYYDKFVWLVYPWLIVDLARMDRVAMIAIRQPNE